MKLRILSIIFLLFSNSSTFANVQCAGSVGGVMLWGNTSNWVAVYLNEHQKTWIICDINNDYGGVSAKSCSAMYSSAITAFASSARLTLHFNTYNACIDVPTFDVNLPGKLDLLYLSK